MQVEISRRDTLGVAGDDSSESDDDEDGDDDDDDGNSVYDDDDADERNEAKTKNDDKENEILRKHQQTLQFRDWKAEVWSVELAMLLS